MTSPYQDEAGEPSASPYIPHALALGKAFQAYSLRGDQITQEETARLYAEALERLKAIGSLEPKEPIDVQILLSCIREVTVAMHPANHPHEENVAEYITYIVGLVERIQDFIASTTGATLQAHGVNLTGELWN